MKKSELVKSMSEISKLTQKDSALALEAMQEAILETLANGEEVMLTGFGKFEVKQKAARVGRNPLTQETITIAAKNAPAFKFSKNIKEMIKESAE